MFQNYNTTFIHPPKDYSINIHYRNHNTYFINLLCLRQLIYEYIIQYKLIDLHKITTNVQGK